MAYRFDTRHLSNTQQAIIRDRDAAEELRKKEYEKAQNVELEKKRKKQSLEDLEKSEMAVKSKDVI